MSKKVIYLVDGTSICYRSFYAINLSNSKGVETGAVYGFYQTIQRIITQKKPDYLAVCFDVSRKTLRHDKFEDYKATRSPLPEGLKAQIPVIRDMVKMMGLKIVEQKGFEADDVIAALTKKALDDDLDVVIVSSDKDFCQLLKDRQVAIYNPNKDRMITAVSFLKDYGFQPENIIDYLALMGDSSDNIPGAKGIGKVGAAKLIIKYRTIENIFDNLECLPTKTKALLEASRDTVVLSKDLVTLMDPELAVDSNSLTLGSVDNEALFKLFTDLEFKKLIKTVSHQPPAINLPFKKDIPRSFLQSKNKKFYYFFKQGIFYVYDEDTEAIYQTDLKDCSQFLRDETVLKVTYDIKKQLIENKDIIVKGQCFDVKIAAYLIDSSLTDYSLDSLDSRYIGEMSKEIPDNFYPYYINRLYQFLSVKLEENNLNYLFYDIEMPLRFILADVQRRGIAVDLKILESLSGKLKSRIASVKEKIFSIAGHDFNLNSPAQVQLVLFEELKIPPVKKTKTGFSTGEDVLEALSKNYPIAALLLEYRHLNKLFGTYVAPLIDMVSNSQGRLHAAFNQTATQTGRLSSSSPNLQSIPARGEFADYLRRAFVSDFKPGFILACDYSQNELRILAHFSLDKLLKEAFVKDWDIHTFTASLLFGVNEDSVDTNQRNLAKRVNFAIIYGMSAYGLSRELAISPLEANAFINDYFQRYSKVKNYIESIYKQVKKTGFVRTVLGRIRYLPDFNSSNHQLREFAHRQAVNTPIQGSCADLIKLAMVKIFREFAKENLQSKLIIQIHDELIFDVPQNELEQVIEIVQRNMEHSFKLKVPLKVNVKYAKNWGDIKGYE
ncbi:MAG: DNA polymerase I [Candidatus Omnitrophica bacterium]|nr:DNA polymerase I [Candidatus Omnitrophota bacterium]